jgi:DNA polymerase
MLDKMFAAIGLSRSADVPQNGIYITNVVPWRPPQNRDPSAAEIDVMIPFVQRHIALVRPVVIVAMGNVSVQALLGQRGITKLRGTWMQAHGFDVLPMLHPAYLLRNPIAKRETWADLLALKQKLGM